MACTMREKPLLAGLVILSALCWLGLALLLPNDSSRSFPAGDRSRRLRSSAAFLF